MNEILLASGNAGKLKELQFALQDYSITLIAQQSQGIDEVAETGATFIENALIKARHGAACSGLPTLADDSGLVVEALQGAPGIHSARYAGEHASAEENNEKLLQALSDVPEKKPAAYFYCVLVLCRNAQDPIPLICQGLWAGSILRKPVGATGFGYDPLFYVSERRCSAAQLTLREKNKLSHRAKAVQQLRKALQSGVL